MANTPRDFIIRSNASDTSTIPSSTSDIVASWDTSVAISGSSISYTASEFTLSEGKYLISYSDVFTTTQTSNSARNMVIGRLDIDGVESIYGQSSTYIRKNASQGNQTGILNSTCIIDIPSDGTSLEVRHKRIDTVTNVLPLTRVTTRSGVSILALDSTWNYGIYESLARVQFANDGIWNTISFATSSQEDSPFTNDFSGNVEIGTATQYLVSYNVHIILDGSGNRTVVEGALFYDGVEIVGTRTYEYVRFSNGIKRGVLTWSGIIDITTAGNNLSLQVVKREGPNGTAYYENVSMQIMELPSETETVILEATTGNMNANNAEFEWDTTAMINTDAFSYDVSNPSEVVINTIGDYYFFSTLFSTQSGTRSYPSGKFQKAVDFTISDVGHASAGAYGRNTGTADSVGYNISAIINDIDGTSDNVVNLGIFRSAPNATTVTNSSGQISGFRIGSLYEFVDTTAPILSSASVGSITSVGGVLTVSTDEGNGTLYWMVDTNSSRTPAQIKTGGGIDDGNQSVSSTGVQVTAASVGGADVTLYYFHVMHEDVATNQSNVISTSFTTLEISLGSTFSSWNTKLQNSISYMNGVGIASINAINSIVLGEITPTTIISSIQHVTGVMTTGISGTVTIPNAVDRSRSIILSQANAWGGQSQTDGNNNAEASMVRFYFTSDTEVTFDRGETQSGHAITTYLQIIEFSESAIDTIETGSLVLSGSNLTATNLIEVGGTSGDWVALNSGFKQTVGGGSGRMSFGLSRYTMEDVVGDVYIKATREDATDTAVTATSEYFAIKFNSGILASTPQQVSITNTSVTASGTITGSDISRTILFPSGKSADMGGTGFDQYQSWQKYGLTSPTNIESTIYSAPDQNTTIQLTSVEFSDGVITSMQSGSVAFDTSLNTLTTTINSVATASSAVFAYGAVSDEGGATPHDPEYSYFTTELTNSTTVTFRRGVASPGTEPLNINYVVVEFT